ncbi:MAG: Histidinol dehydrogenase [Candidatus Moanabacter tarae]|uniref:Histidinol dehydrogenase n=1 Tax=Candidatus Moanibacter tarae TaxID=2200854 RepID=A0A2Z4AEJ2_9BACT|nr:MAG: Histidinol dehydrogenase [Candidatus Moanabacter tarae]|tara:strand:+ start:22553 stop:23872 length:1320 start_codon:yes stop_codon:yes gene_type:complete
MRIVKYPSRQFEEGVTHFCGRPESNRDIKSVVGSILENVQRKGDSAILEYTAKIDGVDLAGGGFRIPLSMMKRAKQSLPKSDLKAIKEAIRCVEDFHKRNFPRDWNEKNIHGARVGEAFSPLDRIGIWIPGGVVPLVSTVIMTVALANIAGIREVTIFTPPQKNGSVNRRLLAAMALCQVKEVYRMAGVPAVGAMAYGTETIRPVCKIFGPGNAYVIEAKRQVFGEIGVDLLPGPSEIMIIADGKARADWVAADLIAQAEHGLGGRVFLVTTSKRLLDSVKIEIKSQVKYLRHRATIEAVLEIGFLAVLVDRIHQAVKVANRIAPEHLEIHTEQSRWDRLMRGIHNAGAIFLGNQTPTVLGDFTAGPSHVLPTGGAGRFLSGLRLSDFFRRTSIVEYDESCLERARETVEAFSRMEQLDGHRHSLRIRLQDKRRESNGG